MKLKILYEDNHIIVVEKPVNIPSQGDKTGDEDMLTIIKKYLIEKYNKPGDAYLGLVHRLDRPTGGVMVFAKTSKAASRLSEQIREKKFEKEYLCIVDGKMEKNTDVYEDYLVKNEKNNLSKVTDSKNKNAKKAKLEYEVIKYNGRTIIISVTCTPHLEILKRYKENNKINNIILITGSFGNGFNSWLSEYKDENFKNYVNESMRWAYSYFIKNADKIYITTNDYASSNVSELLSSQENEIKGKIAYEVIENRKAAIKKAIEESKEGDVIFISGRGNRKVFCNNTKTVEMYLDKEIVNKEIREKKNAN